MPPVIHLVPIRDLPTDPPTLCVEPAGAPGSVAARLLRATLAVPEGTPLVALLRVAVVWTLDTVRLLSWEQAENRFVFTIELRRFAGELGANVQDYAIVEGDLGPLSAGSYECAARLIRPSTPASTADTDDLVVARFTVLRT